jgi:metal-dependent amidase/aminoacylase/carboxypeptidase family protein
MNFSNDLCQQLIAFRKKLHRHPEISKNEYATAQKILNFITPFHPDKIILLYAIYDLSLGRNK